MSTELVTTNGNYGSIISAGDWWNPWPNSPEYHYHYYPFTQPAVTYQIVQTPRCAWCQGNHVDKCPKLKTVVYREDGTVERVEFFD